MPTWQVDFSKEFSIFVKATTREDALNAAIESIENHDVEQDWDTGEWQAYVFSAPVKHSPDHGVKDGVIVNIQDVEDDDA